MGRETTAVRGEDLGAFILRKFTLGSKCRSL